MAFQREVGSGVNRATDYRDLLSKWVAMATSQHVATVAVDSGGTGYSVGDVLTLTHAGAVLDARFEVTSESGGVITGLRINDSGAFSDRAASATVGTGGSGYSVGDILEVQGGTAREKAKFEVATLSGSAVATVTLFETGGAYSSTPSNDAATVGIGPSGFAGDDAAELTVTYTGLIGTTGLSTTGGGNGDATVDITLAETGWTAERNTNDRDENSLDDEKEVVLVGDATGKTNKPYIGFISWSRTSGIDDRYGVAVFGMTAHNSGVAFTDQVGLSPGISADVLQNGGAYLLCDENQDQEMDFWITANDQRLGGVVNINPGAANTDDGEYMHWYAGYGNSFATETEDPYPMFIGASARQLNIDPSAGSQQITGLSEAVAPTGGEAPLAFFRSETSTWISVTNSQNLSTNTQRDHIMFPIAQLNRITGTSDSNNIVGLGPLRFWEDIGSTGRASPTRRYLPTQGSATDNHFPIPLTICSRPGGTVINETLDTLRLQLDGFFWISASNAAAGTISNFSEDYGTFSGDRYRVFHAHVQTQLYSYIAIREDSN